MCVCVFWMQILAWWFNNKTGHHHGNAGAGFHGNRGGGQGSGGGASSTMAAHAAAGLCDEVVALWRLATLNPALTVAQRSSLSAQLMHWQAQCLDRLRKAHIISNHAPANNSNSSSSAARRADWESSFLGFKPAVEACQLDWSDIALPAGVSELVRCRGPWSSSSSVQALAPRSPLTSVQHESSFVDNVASDANCADSHCVVRLKEHRRKVLMPSERFHHSIVCPRSYVAHRTDPEPSTSSYDSDPSGRSDHVKAAAVSSGSVDEQLCYELSKSLTTCDRSSSDSSKIENQSDVSFLLVNLINSTHYHIALCAIILFAF